MKQQRDSKSPHAAGTIDRTAAFQLRMVEDLLRLTHSIQRKLVLNLKHTCLNEQVRTALQAVADAARKARITPELIDAAEPLWINADSDRTQQVLRSVLLNAVRFTPAGGAVRIALAREGDEGIVSVRDTGEGIAPAFVPFVFKVFEQDERGLRRTNPGLKIGLVFVRQLLEAHGGAASVTSGGIGLGAEVAMRWPLVRSE
jgi:signal transduction histidine kinase